MSERYPARRRLGRRADRGQALVEFAFIFPLIAMLAFAFIDLGRAVFELNTLTNAAREASRVAAVNQLDPVSGPWQCLANKPVEDPANPGWTFRGCAINAATVLGLSGADISISYSAPPGTSLVCTPNPAVGCLATVTVVSDYFAITPVAGSLIGPIEMSATSSLPIERLFP